MIPLLKSSAGVRHYWRDAGGDNYEVVSEYDCTDILEQNKAMTTHNDGYSPTREWRRAASIPLILWLKWMNEEGWDAFDPHHSDKLKQKLNSSEYMYLRTAPGQL